MAKTSHSTNIKRTICTTSARQKKSRRFCLAVHKSPRQSRPSQPPICRRRAKSLTLTSCIAGCTRRKRKISTCRRAYRRSSSSSSSSFSSWLRRLSHQQALTDRKKAIPTTATVLASLGRQARSARASRTTGRSRRRRTACCRAWTRCQARPLTKTRRQRLRNEMWFCTKTHRQAASCETAKSWRRCRRASTLT